MAEHRFALRGEVDVVDTPELRSQLLTLVNTTTGDVVVDCEGLAFIDSTGIAVLLSAAARAPDPRTGTTGREPGRTAAACDRRTRAH